MNNRALAAVTHAVTLSNHLGLYADDTEPRSALAEAMMREDAVAAGLALDEAARLLEEADPLGCVDTSEAHADLAEARQLYLTCLTTLGLSVTSRAA